VYDAQERNVLFSCFRNKLDDPLCVDGSGLDINPKQAGKKMDELMNEAKDWPD